VKNTIDWHCAKLTRATRIDAGYRSTQNVRRFFKAQLGEDFHFTRAFMRWLKTHAGSTLGDAIEEWRRA
jgi:hypothetical protein